MDVPSLASPAASFSPPTTPSYFPSFNPTITFTILIVAIVFFLAAVLRVYLVCLRRRQWISQLEQPPPLPGSVVHAPATGAPAAARLQGVDPSVIESFPSFSFKEGENLPEDGGLGALLDAEEGGRSRECAVCLGEYAPGEVIKKLPSCGHLFHAECIVVWLAAKVTCPICRAVVVGRTEGVEERGELAGGRQASQGGGEVGGARS